MHKRCCGSVENVTSMWSGDVAKILRSGNVLPQPCLDACGEMNTFHPTSFG